MRKYEKWQRRMAMLKTVAGCIGWGLLGYVIMAADVGLFWLGWVLMVAALCISAYSVDKYLETSGRSF